MIPAFLALLLSLAAGAGPLEDRLAAAEAAFASVQAGHQAGAARAEEVWRWSARVLEAAEALGPADEARRAHLARVEALEREVARQVAAGLAPGSEAAGAAWYLADARARLER